MYEDNMKMYLRDIDYEDGGGWKRLIIMSSHDLWF